MSKPTTDTLSDEQIAKLRERAADGFEQDPRVMAALDELLRLRAERLITIELTNNEQISLLGLIIDNTNPLIAKGDPNNWLPDLESIEEKIRGAQDDAACENAKLPIIYDERSA